MNNQYKGTNQDRHKTIIIYFLYLGAITIIFLGFFFSAFSVMNNIKLQVLGTSIPGIVFGMLVAYLGLRYFLMVADFKMEFFRSTEKFSWSNFKKLKKKYN